MGLNIWFNKEVNNFAILQVLLKKVIKISGY
jgi:hypothetical protein